MAVIELHYRSQILRMSTTVTILLPDIPVPEGGFPTVYLLHGFSEDDSAWLRHSRIEDHVGRRGMAVVLPCGYNSAYTDMRYGMNYFSYLADELPKYLASVLPLSRDPKKTFVGGDSMGGYGAMKWALSRPDFFGAVCSFSGSLRVQDRMEGKSANSGNQCAGMYGDPPVIIPEEQDLFFMLGKLKEKAAEIPRIFCCCGTADKPHVYGAYLNFTKYAGELGVPVVARETKDAGHTWDFWESMIPEVLDWMMET